MSVFPQPVKPASTKTAALHGCHTPSFGEKGAATRRASRFTGRGGEGSFPNARYTSRNLLPQLSHFPCLPGRAGGSPTGLGRANRPGLQDAPTRVLRLAGLTGKCAFAGGYLAPDPPPLAPMGFRHRAQSWQRASASTPTQPNASKTRTAFPPPIRNYHVARRWKLGQAAHQ